MAAPEIQSSVTANEYAKWLIGFLGSGFVTLLGFSYASSVLQLVLFYSALTSLPHSSPQEADYIHLGRDSSLPTLRALVYRERVTGLIIGVIVCACSDDTARTIGSQYLIVFSLLCSFVAGWVFYLNPLTYATVFEETLSLVCGGKVRMNFFAKSLGYLRSTPGELDATAPIPTQDLSPPAHTPTSSVTGLFPANTANISATSLDFQSLSPSSSPNSTRSSSSSLSSPSQSMSEYVIPTAATAEMLEQMVQETEGKLKRTQAAVDAATDEATRAALTRDESRLQAFLMRLESRKASADIGTLAGTVQRNTSDIEALKVARAEHSEALGDVNTVLQEAVARILSLEKSNQALRNAVDGIDNQVRKQNALVFGMPLQNVDTAVETLFSKAGDLVADLDDAFFLGADPAKKNPLKLQFKCCSAATNFIKFARSRAFFSDRATRTFSVGRDKTTLRRVGESRLAAATPALLAKFPGATVTPSGNSARVGGVKYDAILFAAPRLIIGDSEFNIEAACRSNDEYEPVDTLSVDDGDSSTQGFRKKKTRSGDRGRPEEDRDENMDDDSSDSGQGVVQGGAAGTSGRGGGRGGRGFAKQWTGGGGGRGGQGRGRQNTAMSAPHFNGFNSGGVSVSAGGNYGGGGRLDLVSAIPNRYEVRG